MKELLKELSLAFGPSGCEDEVRDIIENYLKGKLPKNAEMYRDVNGGLTVHIPREGAKKLMINAHMDEVGFMITHIEENGLLRFGCVGGIDSIVLASKLVVSERGVKGNIIAKPIHVLTPEEREKKTKVENMFIDIGATSREDAMKSVFVGEYFTFSGDYVEYGDGYIKCKALDDRLGCAIMCRAIEEIAEKNIETEYDLYFAFTCREEVGYSGAFGASEKIKPDYAVVIESKAVADVLGVGERKKVCILGDGAIVSLADLGTIYDIDFTNHIMELCQKNDIKYQIHRIISGGNDSRNIQTSVCGAKVGLLSAASRYIHSPCDVVHRDDLECIYRALMAIIEDKER